MWIFGASPTFVLGVLACLDGYMNIAMEQTEEFVEGQLKAKYGDCFIRGNNGTSFVDSGSEHARIWHGFPCLIPIHFQCCTFQRPRKHNVVIESIFSVMIHAASSLILFPHALGQLDRNCSALGFQFFIVIHRRLGSQMVMSNILLNQLVSKAKSFRPRPAQCLRSIGRTIVGIGLPSTVLKGETSLFLQFLNQAVLSKLAIQVMALFAFV